MLDNFSPEQLLADAKEFKKQSVNCKMRLLCQYIHLFVQSCSYLALRAADLRFPHVLVEASGGITKDTIAQFLR